MTQQLARLRGPALFAHPVAPATIVVLRRRGYAGATIAEICAEAQLEPRILPSGLRQKPALVLAVSEAYAENLRERVGAAFSTAPSWPDNLRAVAYEGLRWFLEHPDAVWWGMVGVLEAGEVARARRDEVFGWAARHIEAGRELAPDPEAVPPSAPTIALGAILESLGRLARGTLPEDPVEAVPRLMYSVVRPYLGEEAARKELEIPPPPDLRSARS